MGGYTSAMFSRRPEALQVNYLLIRKLPWIALSPLNLRCPISCFLVTRCYGLNVFAPKIYMWKS